MIPHPSRSRLVAFALVLGCVAAGISGCSAASSIAASGIRVSGISVATGSLSGGTELVLNGTGLEAVTGVDFGTAHASQVVAVNDEQVTLITPASDHFAEGAHDITLFVGDSPARSGLSFEYRVLTPADQQMAYAFQHFAKRNTEDYGSLGGADCVNFTSQTLLARGWKLDEQWWHTKNDAGHDYGKPWISSTAMMNYLLERPELATQLGDGERASVAIGDIVQFDWDSSGDRDHTGVVSRVTGTGDDIEVFVVSHSPDTDYISVDKIITTDHPGADVYYWHLAS